MARAPIGPKLRFEILKRDNFACRYCGCVGPDIKLHVDHVVPVKAGGPTVKSNLITACEDCNRGKAASILGEDLASHIHTTKAFGKTINQCLRILRIMRAKGIWYEAAHEHLFIMIECENIPPEFIVKIALRARTAEIFQECIWAVGEVNKLRDEQEEMDAAEEEEAA